VAHVLSDEIKSTLDDLEGHQKPVSSAT